MNYSDIFILSISLSFDIDKNLLNLIISDKYLFPNFFNKILIILYNLE